MESDIRRKAKEIAEDIRNGDPLAFYDFCESLDSLDWPTEPLWILSCLEVTGDFRQCCGDGQFTVAAKMIQDWLVDAIEVDYAAELMSERQADSDRIESRTQADAYSIFLANLPR